MLTSIAFSVAVKGIQAVLGFAILHFLIGSWGADRYGVWAAMTSLIGYAALFDFGVGYGVKNRIAEAHAVNRLAEAEAHASFGIAFYGTMSVVIFVLGLLVFPHASPFREHLTAAILLWAGFVASFFLSFANIILQAMGRFRIANGLGTLTPLLWYAYLRSSAHPESIDLSTAAVVYAALLTLQGVFAVVAVRRIWDFDARVRWAHVRHLARPVLMTGMKFFALQAASLALFYSGTLLAFHHLGAAEVARFDAANKIFSVFSIGFAILVSITWTEISKAKSVGDRRRLTRMFLFLNVAAIGVCIVAGAAAWLSPLITPRLTNVRIESAEAACFASLVGVQSLAFSSAVFLNAFEKLWGQVALAVVSVPLFFIAAITLLGHGFGIGAIPLASMLAVIPALLYCFATTLRLLQRRPAPAAYA